MKCIWKLNGIVEQIISTQDKFARPYWKVVVKLDSGNVMLFVHDEGLFATTIGLRISDQIEVIGEIIPKANECNKPYFLNPTEIRVLVQA